VHGQEQEVQLGGRRVLLYPIYHPAAALYTPKMLEVLQSDFARIPELLGRVLAPPPEPVLAAPLLAGLWVVADDVRRRVSVPLGAPADGAAIPPSPVRDTLLAGCALGLVPTIVTAAAWLLAGRPPAPETAASHAWPLLARFFDAGDAVLLWMPLLGVVAAVAGAAGAGGRARTIAVLALAAVALLPALLLGAPALTLPWALVVAVALVVVLAGALRCWGRVSAAAWLVAALASAGAASARSTLAAAMSADRAAGAIGLIAAAGGVAVVARRLRKR
jgi:hypothetical protein